MELALLRLALHAGIERSALLRNDPAITRNPWVWASLLLCTVLLAVPHYVAPIAHVMDLAPVTPLMWVVIVCLSATPLLTTQALTLMLLSSRTPLTMRI
jgi:Ca2+-transporting ATPase